MTQRLIVAEWDCVGGPYDGTPLPAFGHQMIVKQFEKSTTAYVYRKAVEDTGAPYWEFVGAIETAVAA